MHVVCVLLCDYVCIVCYVCVVFVCHVVYVSYIRDASACVKSVTYCIVTHVYLYVCVML